ncbi:hypothetical protein Tco_0434765 [Tanacetum coccineum]
MSSIKRTSVVHEKTMTPRSCLRWKPTGKIFKTVGLRWVPTGKIFTSSTAKVDSEPINGSNDDITNQYECKQSRRKYKDLKISDEKDKVLMIDELSIVETDMVNHTVETNMVKLVIEIECFGMSFDEFDKETKSSDGLQPMQSDLSCFHTLNEPHLHEIHVVPNKHEADQC